MSRPAPADPRCALTLAADAPGAGAGAAPGSNAMLDMLRDPEMQKMVYPYLPEPMRNPQTFDFMLNNPQMRAQMEQMISQQVGSMRGGAP